MKREENIKILCVVAERGTADKILKKAGKFLNYPHILLGHGTANSEVLDVLGIGETEKDVLLAAVCADKLTEVFKYFSEKLNLEKAGHGIAFTVPINSVGGMVSLQLLSGKLIKQ